MYEEKDEPKPRSGTRTADFLSHAGKAVKKTVRNMVLYGGVCAAGAAIAGFAMPEILGIASMGAMYHLMNKAKKRCLAIKKPSPSVFRKLAKAAGR